MEAGRDEVLRWMAKNGRGWRTASEHFALPPERVKKWARVVREARPPEGPQKAPAIARKSAEKVGTKEAGNTKAASRARDLPPDMCADMQDGLRGIAAYLGASGKLAALRAKQMLDRSPDSREPEIELPDMGQVAHAARALDIGLARLPDWMTFDERTSQPEATQGDGDALAAAMGVDTSKPPALKVVNGGAP